MDGNGRWAEKRNHNRVFGHLQGAKKALSIIKYCSQIGLPFLSLFALSTENVQRPKKELEALTNLLEKVFFKYSNWLIQEKIKLHILGETGIFSNQLQTFCKDLCEKTKNHTGLNLIIALNYGGRQEILKAFQKIVTRIQKGSLPIKDINEQSLLSSFCTSPFPDPDLIIRTGGQIRLSNFYLWSIAYSEFHFTDTLWPDFNPQHLEDILKNFLKIKRRFGKI